MDKIYMSNHIKLEILTICGQPTSRSYNLEGCVALASLGYNDDLHRKTLEERLQSIANYYNTGKLIVPGIISKDFTVSQCLQLVLN